MPLFTFLRNSVVILPFMSFIIAITDNNFYLLALTIGLLISAIINHLIKIITIQFPSIIFKRPKGAIGCSGGYDNRPCGGEPGFPSGHSQNAWTGERLSRI